MAGLSFNTTERKYYMHWAESTWLFQTNMAWKVLRVSPGTAHKEQVVKGTWRKQAEFQGRV